ncbi:hypothetical protein IIF17_004308 [Salmonella enterica]|nr:hypothetical protein [Salmonella enterica]
MSNIKSNVYPADVRRDNYGWWVHPAYAAFCDNRDFVDFSEFEGWLKANSLEWTYRLLDTENACSAAAREYVCFGTLTNRKPEPPKGEGWFVCSIHVCDDGPICIWLRRVTH